MFSYLFGIISILVFESIVDAQPVSIAAKDLTTVPTARFPIKFNFMRKYGYLDSNPSDSEAQYKDEAVLDAIKRVQRYGALPVTGVIDISTLRLMRARRCGVTDVSGSSKRPRRFILGSFGWKKRTITYFVANWNPKIGKQNVANEMAKAFAKWAPYGRLKFIEVANPSADIIVGFGSGYHGDREPFDGPGNTLAHAYYPYENDAYGGDIHFDNDENWQTSANSSENMYSNGVEFLDVATHEIGHSLGLAHSPVYGSIMFPYYKGDQRRFSELDYDDILGMHRLYIQNRMFEDDEEFELKNEIITTTTTTTTTKIFDELPVASFTTTPASPTISSTLMPINHTFIGDYETVDNHRIRFAENLSIQNNETYVAATETYRRPDVCLGHFDAVALIRGEVFIFKGDLVWRLTANYHIQHGYPIRFRHMFNGLPASVERIDAAYERPHDNAIVLFTGKQYWVHDGYTFIESSPQPITNYGLPLDVDVVNAVIIWSRTGATYIFVGSVFWRYNENFKRTEEGYPRNISRWGGIPANVNSAVTLANGKTYFFKNNVYWLLNNFAVRPEKGYPRRAAKFWLNCPTHYFKNLLF